MKYLLILCLVFICSCAKITYRDGEVSYWRLGNQTINDLEFTKAIDGTFTVTFDKQEGSSGDLAEAILNLSRKIP